MKKYLTILKLLIIICFSIALDYLCILLSYRVTQFDLGQLAYIFFIFLPVSALVSGIITQIGLKKILFVPLVSLLSFTAFILIRYNRSGLTYLPLYTFISMVGGFIVLGIQILMKKRNSHKQ